MQTLEQGQFELYTSFQGVTLKDGADSMSFCAADDAGIDTVYLIDLDGGLRPSSVSTSGRATLVSNGPQIQKFVDLSKCTAVTAGCYSYCRDTCFRSVRYEVAASGSEKYMLKVCKNGDSSNCALFAGSRRSNSPNSSEPRTFIAHVPVGMTYNAVFLDNTGQAIQVPSVLAQYENSLCAGGEFAVYLDGTLPGTPPLQ